MILFFHRHEQNQDCRCLQRKKQRFSKFSLRTIHSENMHRFFFIMVERAIQNYILTYVVYLYLQTLCNKLKIYCDRGM